MNHLIKLQMFKQLYFIVTKRQINSETAQPSKHKLTDSKMCFRHICVGEENQFINLTYCETTLAVFFQINK